MTRPRLRVALVGMGKMGRALDALAAERGIDVVARLGHGDVVTRAALGAADVAIEFTEPRAASANVRACLAAGCPIVVGTTGWLDELPALTREVQATQGRMLWSANYSVGVNAMLRLAALAGALFRDAGFDVRVVETHHAQKRDAPSGTAIALAASAGSTLAASVPITSVRLGHVAGTHDLVFDGPFEQLRLVHEARDRRVFADGALTAAAWLASHGDPGVFTMSDVLSSASETATSEETK